MILQKRLPVAENENGSLKCLLMHLLRWCSLKRSMKTYAQVSEQYFRPHTLFSYNFQITLCLFLPKKQCRAKKKKVILGRQICQLQPVVPPQAVGSPTSNSISYPRYSFLVPTWFWPPTFAFRKHFLPSKCVDIFLLPLHFLPLPASIHLFTSIKSVSVHTCAQK